MSGLVVAFESSTLEPSVALRSAAGELHERAAPGRRHASELLPALETLLAQAGLLPGEIRLVAAGTGPGSYTGLRVGIATALGLARGAGAELLGVPSFEVLVFGRLRPGEEATVLHDARRGELACARYRRLELEVEVLEPPRLIAVEGARAVLSSTDRFLADDRVAALLAAAGLELERRDAAQPHARDLLALAIERHARQGAMAPEDVQPLYLAPFRASARRS